MRRQCRESRAFLVGHRATLARVLARGVAFFG